MAKNPLISYIRLGQELVKFDQAQHKYTLGGKDLISVSKFISLFKTPFDQDGAILKRCAEKKGLPPEVLKAEWEKTKQDACDYGSNFHTEIEYYIKYREIRETQYKQILREFAKIKFGGQLYSEIIIFDEECGIAGTCDIIEYFPKTSSLSCYDLKTSKKIDKYSYWKNKMLPPIEYRDDVNFLNFELQLSLYAYILDNQGFWVDELSIFHVNKKTETIEQHMVEYRREEVVLMLEYYKKHGDTRPVNDCVDDDFDF